MRSLRITFGVLLSIMVCFSLAAKTVKAQGAGMAEKQVQEKQPQVSMDKIRKVINSVRPIRDGMTIVSIDADGVKVWANVKKADWSATDWMVFESDTMPPPYALLIPISQPSTTEAADKGGTKKPTPTPTPDQCFDVVVNSNGDFALGSKPHPCPPKKK
jgi:hypothetical protein